MKLRTKRVIMNSLHAVLSLFFMVICLFTLIFFTLNICYHSTYVYGHSMYPTLNSHVLSDSEQGDLVLVNRYKEARVGDIVIATPSWSPNKTVIKRLIGKPGDTIEILESDTTYDLYCNGNLLYSKAKTNGNKNKFDLFNNQLAEKGLTELTLNEDEYFIMGDNWGNSSDSVSNNLKTITKAQLRGRVDLVVDKSESKFWGLLGYGLKVLFSI